MEASLNNHHRDTLAQIFEHPPSENVEWHRVLSLLDAVGETRQEHNGKLVVTVGTERETFHAPHGKDVDKQMLVDIRRMLKSAGYGPD